MRDALNRTGKVITYAIDDWGVTNTWNYGQEVCPVAQPVLLSRVSCNTSSARVPGLPGLGTRCSCRAALGTCLKAGPNMCFLRFVLFFYRGV